MDLKLKGKRALVTGSSAGLGEAIAVMLAAEGVTVVVHGRNIERTEKVAQDIIETGGLAEVAIGDLATDEGADAVVRAALSGGAIDILVNNAGIYHHGGWMDGTSQTWIDTYNTNVVSGVRMIHRLIPQMRELKWGRVITIGGGLGIQPIPLQPDYNATLAARHNLSVSLARELKNSGITSNVVSPGAMLTELTQEFFRKVAPQFGWGDNWDDIERAAVSEFVPNDVGRLGRADEIAAAVLYLASPYADYISGAMIRVDGGTIRSIH